MPYIYTILIIPQFYIYPSDVPLSEAVGTVVSVWINLANYAQKTWR